MGESGQDGTGGMLRRIVAWVLGLRIVRAYLLYIEHRGPMLADSITYRALFSIFAGVLLVFSFAALWLSGAPDAMHALTEALDAMIPGLSKVVDVSSIDAPVGFTLIGVLSLVGLVGAAISAIGSLRAALHILADEVVDDVFFVWVILRNLLVAACLGALLAVAALASVFGVAGVGAVMGWLGMSSHAWPAVISIRLVDILVVFVVDTLAIVLLFVVLAGIRPPARALWIGAMIGGLGLTVLQELSGLFVRGAASNPLLASFAALIALLIWFNLSAQVILLAGSHIITAASDAHDRDAERPAARTMEERRVRRAEDRVRVAEEELQTARDAVQPRRDG
ncbi:YihY/virulence factor BrkB family protein [Microbacterium sp. ASV49]|uniref:YihY/virulence factor BrkB family protein n=1 Tax=Microbacterium candidum TaxID=3041922 RepID=A0ABT7N494_9MICO|nr:YihY/virulence factor BrkB family protein [Microbacterium sp. ASV49]MDL9981512.1 YihY/virulence factor BrkB family protein [Microbacterium sp. ASV49]